jgi:hypothetical protein
MKNMTSLLVISMLVLTSVVSASASQDAGTHASRMETAAAANMVKTSYMPSELVQSSQVALSVPVDEAEKSVADERLLGSELPQNSALTLLAGLAIIVVIGKRRMSN